MRFESIIQHAPLALAGALMVLCSCGKAPQPDTPAETAAAPAPTPAPTPSASPDPRPVIVAFGDSLTAGFGADPGQSYPDFLQRDLDRAGYRYRVVNQGVSGDTTSGGLTRVEQAVAIKPAIVIVELGGNDGLRGIPVQNIRENLAAILSQLKPSGARILLADMTLPPNYGEEYVRSFQQVYADLARQDRVPSFVFPFRDLYVKRLLQPDGIHATAAGNALVADAVMRALRPLLVRENPQRRG